MVCLNSIPDDLTHPDFRRNAFTTDTEMLSTEKFSAEEPGERGKTNEKNCGTHY